MSIRLTTLGGLRVTRNERELDRLLARPSLAALLVYLAVERRTTREALLGVFWAESDPQAARHALRQALYRLRKALGKECIRSQGVELRIGPQVRTDLEAFRSLVDAGDPVSAAKLYGGSFLAGLHLADTPQWETWVDARRAGAARAFRNACRAWIDERRNAGDRVGAVEAAERWAVQDPFDDEAHHELVQSLAEAGRRTQALRHFHAHVAALEREGLHPLPKTVALSEELGEIESSTSHPQVRAPLPDPGHPESAPEPLLPTESTSIDRSRPTSRALVAGMALGALALALILGLLSSRPGPTDQPGAGVATVEVGGGDVIVLAEFGAPATDSLLGKVIADALRIDLMNTQRLGTMEPLEVREILARMQLPPESTLDAALAREVALRGGARAVLHGDVSRAGAGYVLTATLRAAATGVSLAAFRESAATDDDLIQAIGRLGSRIRTEVGEPLAAIPDPPSLEAVTTSSLDALRLMSQATRAYDRGDYPSTIMLFEEALDLDPEFAMAWRGLSYALQRLEIDRSREMEAVRRAYELRDRLTARERLLATARYHALVTDDHDRMVAAYRSVLEIAPDDRSALNNLGAAYHHRQDYEAAAAMFRRAVEAPAPSAVAFLNLAEASIALGDLDAAHRALDACAAGHPENPEIAFRRFWIRLIEGDTAAARVEMEPLASNPTVAPAVRARAHDHLARLALRHGRIALARDHFGSAEEIARFVGPSEFAVHRLFHAHAEVVAGNPDRALTLLNGEDLSETLRTLAPEDRWHFLRAIVLAMAGRPREARNVLQEFERDVPPRFHGSFQMRNESARALVLLLEGEADEAVRVLREIRTEARCRACYAERMGWALSKTGRLQDAAEEWETALAWQDFTHAIEWQFAQNLWTLQRLPALYERLGDDERALALHRRLAELWIDADPELRPRMNGALDRIATLERRQADSGGNP